MWENRAYKKQQWTGFHIILGFFGLQVQQKFTAGRHLFGRRHASFWNRLKRKSSSQSRKTLTPQNQRELHYVTHSTLIWRNQTMNLTAGAFRNGLLWVSPQKKQIRQQQTSRNERRRERPSQRNDLWHKERVHGCRPWRKHRRQESPRTVGSQRRSTEKLETMFHAVLQVPDQKLAQLPTLRMMKQLKVQPPERRLLFIAALKRWTFWKICWKVWSFLQEEDPKRQKISFSDEPNFVEMGGQGILICHCDECDCER